MDWAREHRGAKQSFLRQVTSKLDQPLDTTRCAGDGTVERKVAGNEPWDSPAEELCNPHGS